MTLTPRNPVGAFKSTKEDLGHEERAINRVWAKRDKEIERVVVNIAGMYGDMHGVTGASLPRIKMLALSAGEAEGETAL